ncbi:Photosynthetic apparatus regulatory protein RegA [Sinobacterium norvegicum]|uniref:Photosynthetic apparatus regulatory protein RegA n=1 Tax=Sinobacterium norvegicum TaxID=1641715 RepID=A0ABN8EKL7_9GAMM|nr:response regulator transcription factor [Sinobacterium norvegicum]CAH0992629.1 Photosynthetic apparatus regulatory protein RegA [Sinobacterium norvegicum]
MTTHYLLVDDDQVFTTAMQRALQRKGFEADCCHSAQSCLQQLDKKQYHHLLLDMKLGDDSGLQLIEAIIAKAPNTQIVILTGYSSIATAVKAIKLGAHNYLCKPARSNDIIAAFGQCTDDSPNIESETLNTTPSVKRMEWEHIQRVLTDNDGNVSATARVLGMHRRTLQRKLAKSPSKQ